MKSRDEILDFINKVVNQEIKINPNSSGQQQMFATVRVVIKEYFKLRVTPPKRKDEGDELYLDILGEMGNYIVYHNTSERSSTYSCPNATCVYDEHKTYKRKQMIEGEEP